ncbi:monovalent cation:proton antiporter-2 (CPA2) family protein [Chitiniphilus purpureus]|uniref:Monovalent cation:proton antiporter-2 (CPA2) family protein n=1 Tax=Chitiniphilus purpureus TaxID=2981137 RepID=A0ABY6DLF2_9NEIS|nr:monovalent cation:proton antiporter-2 (CPA2) family protein [Chitiniphilus sp. CD1]UXY13956.1 monovalent cation:proton antiporter-2 (CPA2) family protein [Chitiniphilus sp. CD1]
MTLTSQITLFLCAAVVMVPLFRRAGLGAILGYLCAGVLIGPWGLGLVTQVERILHFSELGVVLLLFVIGLELQPSRLWVLRRSVFGLGGAQVILSAVLIGGAALLLQVPPAAALVAGLGLALSSTALVLQMLAEKKQLTTRHGRDAFAILLFQDLAVIPLLALLPLLSGGALPDGAGVLKAVAVVAGVVLGGHWLLRPALRLVARSRAPEVFAAAALLVVLGTALLMQQVGLSMSLGAFLAGVLLADSEYRHELEATIEPFKGLLLGLFFIAVGMSANLGLLTRIPGTLAMLVLGLVLCKFAVLYVLGRLTGSSGAAARHLGVALAQGGEFAFVLFTLAAGSGVMARPLAETLVLVVTLSMAATPLLALLHERVVAPRLAPVRKREFDTIEPADDSRVIIAGFGRVGQIVGRALRLRKIPFTALEASPDQVDFVRRFGNQVFYGDASRLELLRAAHAERAELLVLAIDDVEASIRTAETVRRHFPRLTVLARARNRAHAYRLMDLGVQLIERETYHSSLKMARDALQVLGLPQPQAAATVDAFRRYDEQLLLRQHATHHDETQLIQSTREAMRELESLFEADSNEVERQRRQGVPD